MHKHSLHQNSVHVHSKLTSHYTLHITHYTITSDYNWSVKIVVQPKNPHTIVEIIRESILGNVVRRGTTVQCGNYGCFLGRLLRHELAHPQPSAPDGGSFWLQSYQQLVWVVLGCYASLENNKLLAATPPSNIQL